MRSPTKPSSSDCGDNLCLVPVPPTALGTVISLGPFIATFAAVSLFVARRVFPHLSRTPSGTLDGEDHYLPASAPPTLQQAHAEHGARSLRRRVAAATFAATVGLATVLAELILSEMSELVSPHAREVALRLTVPTLLFVLVVLIPFLELQSFVTGSGWSFQRSAKGRTPRMAWTLQAVAFGGWIFTFWSLGRVVPPGAVTEHHLPGGRGLSRACLERIGVIGIWLMALLSGFASVSSPWHTFADNWSYRQRPITDVDISRKQAGLDATSEMLMTKRHRLRSLQRRIAMAEVGSKDGSSSGLVGKVIGSLKGMGGGGDGAEIKSLQLEISGLEIMEANLASTLGVLRSRQAAHSRDGTALGRLLAMPSYAFSLYCIYRILATTLSSLRRVYYPSASFSSSDPINRFLGLLAKHWDPKLDQIAWARQISFLLSGVILAASANSVLQTFHLFAKWLPGLLYQAQANFALLIGQIAATYVISAALLLRSHLPKEMGRSVGDALESALEPGFVDRWFEGWFLVASVATAAGIWVGRKIGSDSAMGGGEWDELDEYGREEIGGEKLVKGV